MVIADNCSGHSVNAKVSDVRIITLLSRKTALHQPLGLGLIVGCKVCYRSFLLRSVISVVESKLKGNIEFRPDSQRGTYGIRDGHLTHIGNALKFFSEAWSATKNSPLIKL